MTRGAAVATRLSPTRARLSGRRRGLGVAGLAFAALLAELLPRSGVIDDRFLPPGTVIARALFEDVRDGAFWGTLLLTLRTWSIGLVAAVVAGVAFGMLIGSMPLLRQFTATMIEFARPIPSVALVPLAVLLFGTAIQSTLLLVVYAAFWQVLGQVIYGVQDVDPVARDTARCYRFRRVVEQVRLVWPTTLPYVVTGFRLAATVALVLTITGELLIGTPGLGQRLGVAQQSGAVPEMYAIVLVTGLLGVAVNTFVRVLERRVLHWHPAIRREGAR